VEREPIINRAANSIAEYVSCTVCNWGVAVVPTPGTNTQAEIERLYKGHHCEDFPRCDVGGCRNTAFYGFREIRNTSISTGSGFVVPLSVNWCGAHDASMRQQCASKTGRYIDLMPKEGQQD
jgi:hypothetical protein